MRRLLLLLCCLPVLSMVGQQAATPTNAATPLQVAFTFDDLPAHGPLPTGVERRDVAKSILATLKREKMPPTYGFINGFRVEQFPYQIEILRDWMKAGNLLGNHTWSHPELDKLSVAEYEENIARNEPMLRKVSKHADWHWFRYPFLEEGNTVEKREAVRAWLKEHGYRIAEVSMDFQDWAWNEPYARCMNKHDDAAVQSLHDSYLASADESIRVYRLLAQELYQRDVPYVLLMHLGAFDARMLPELLALFRSRGFTFVTLPQTMADSTYNVDPKVIENGGTTFNEFIATARKVEAPPVQDKTKELDAMCR